MIQMESLVQYGLVSRKIYGHYCFLWLWGAQRCDHRHERLYSQSPSRYWRRVARVKALIERIRPLRAGFKPENVPFAIGRINK